MMPVPTSDQDPSAPLYNVGKIAADAIGRQYVAGETIPRGSLVTLDAGSDGIRLFLSGSALAAPRDKPDGYAAEAGLAGVVISMTNGNAVPVPDAIWDVAPVTADLGKDVRLSATPGKSTLTGVGAIAGTVIAGNELGQVNRGMVHVALLGPPGGGGGGAVTSVNTEVGAIVLDAPTAGKFTALGGGGVRFDQIGIPGTATDGQGLIRTGGAGNNANGLPASSGGAVADTGGAGGNDLSGAGAPGNGGYATYTGGKGGDADGGGNTAGTGASFTATGGAGGVGTAGADGGQAGWALLLGGTGGDAIGGGTGGVGGSVLITGGEPGAGGADRSGGAVAIAAGAGFGTSAGRDVTSDAGINQTGAGGAGHNIMRGGAATTGTAGDARLIGGVAAGSGTAGDAEVFGGDSGNGSPGVVGNVNIGGGDDTGGGTGVVNIGLSTAGFPSLSRLRASLDYAYVSSAANTVLDVSHHVLNITVAAKSITLPTVVGGATVGRVYRLKSTAGTTTIKPGAGTIDGVGGDDAAILAAANSFCTLIHAGGNAWLRIG
jgi:hypothetical protein